MKRKMTGEQKPFIFKKKSCAMKQKSHRTVIRQVEHCKSQIISRVKYFNGLTN